MAQIDDLQAYVNFELPRRSVFLTKSITSYDADPNLGGAPAIMQGAPLGTWFYQETADKWWRKIGSGSTDWQEQNTGTPTAPTWYQDEFVPTAGQITFILSNTPTDPDSLEVSVNGVRYDDVSDYTLSGTTLTWLNPFVLRTIDKLIAQYH